jgi:hypothetical protein
MHVGEIFCFGKDFELCESWNFVSLIAFL